METSDNQSLQQTITETIAEARIFQGSNGAYPITIAVIEHLIGRVEENWKNQQYQTVIDSLRNIQEVMAKPEPRERVSGQVQIVTAATWEEAKEQCPWACRFQPAGKQGPQQGKWICFETDDDADFYRELQDT